MAKIVEIKFIYLDTMDLGHMVGKYLVDGNEYELRYTEDNQVTGYHKTGIYRMIDGELRMDTKIQITGDSYIEVNRSTGATHRVDSRYGAAIDRYDKKGRDLVQIIKNSIVEWKRLK
jgi:hypothetical protein